MRAAMLALCLTALCLTTGLAFAQTPPPTKDSPNTTGRTIIPEKKEQGQPQGNAGTTGSGAPSPQGDAPPRAQPALEDPPKQAK